MKRPALAALVFLLPYAAFAAWSYEESKDSMTGKAQRMAVAQSANKVTFPFPYGGPQEATLLLRIHPRYGRNAILSFPRAHFLCGMDGCNVLVRFDDKPPMRFRASEPADHSTDTLFIRDYAGFVNGLRVAKRVRIEAQFYQAGARVVDFDVSGLQWEDTRREPAAPTARGPTKEDCIQRWRKANGGQYASESFLACDRDPTSPPVAKRKVEADAPTQSREEISRDMRAIERKAREANP